MKPTTKNRGKTQNFFLFSPFCFILLVLSQSREGWNPSLSEVLGMLNRLGAVAADSQPFKRLNPSLHPFFFSLLNGNNIQGDTFRRNLCLASVSALCRPGSRSSHCSLLFGGCPSCRCMLQNLFIWVLFWGFFPSFPALLSEMILLGCLDDDDFPSHPFLWEGFLPADIFFLSEFSACRSSLFPPRGGTSPLPITSRTRIKIPAIHRFFSPPLS